MRESSPRFVGDLAHGDHGCLVCESDREHWALVSAYVRHGLARGERTLYLTASRSESEVRRMLDIDRIARGQLMVLPAVETRRGGSRRFDAVARLGGWKDHVYAALDDGFSGFRAVVEMAWLLKVDLPLQALVEYERNANGLFRGLPGSILCVYDRRRFEDFTLARAGHAHSFCFGRLLAPAPVLRSDLLEIRTAGPGALALSGEVDVANVATVVQAVEAAADDQGRLVIDMSELGFIDFAALRAIHDLSRRIGDGAGELVLLSPPTIARRMIELLGSDGSLTVDDGSPQLA